MSNHPHKNLASTSDVPYLYLAQIYDHVMRHVDYEQWCDYIQMLFTRFKVTPSRILELACGTGTMSCLLAHRGYQMAGLDRSESMIKIAEGKSRETGLEINYSVGDMICTQPANSYDAILCLYDSINYVTEEADLLRMFRNLNSIISPGGLLIFDACTEINSRRYFHNQVDRESTKDFSYIRKCEYLPETRIQVNEFQFTFNHTGKRYSTRERHQQRIYPVEKLAELCSLAGYSILGQFDGFTLKTASENSNRVHYVVSPLTD